MEDLLRIRRELAGLRVARAEALGRAFRGQEPDLVAAGRRFPAVLHEETPQIIDEALRKADGEAERAGLIRLQSALKTERVRAAAVRLEEGLLRRELVAMAEGPEGALQLRAAFRAVAHEAQRGRRERLAEACARAVDEERSRRADWIALQQEALGREGATPAALAGVDDALLAEARAVLTATDDAFGELMPWALGRWVQEGLQPLPRGDLHDHDLAWLRAGIFVGAAFPGGALRLVTTSLVEQMDFDERQRNIRLDLERRPLACMGALVTQQQQRATISLSPRGTPADWPDLFGALPAALAAVSIRPASYEEFVLTRDGAVEGCFESLFRSIVREPIFYRRVLEAARAIAEDAQRLFALLELLELRTLCGRALHEAEIWARAPSKALARSFGEQMAQATGARFDERFYLDGADVALPAATALRGRALLGAIRPALRERLDEDWWRNPRTGPLLQDLMARGATLPAQALPALLGAGEPSLGAYARDLIAKL